MQRLFADVHLVLRVTSGYSGAGGRFPAIFGMPVSPIVTAIGSDGRAETGSEIGSPSSRVLHELSRLAHHACSATDRTDRQRAAAARRATSAALGAGAGRRPGIDAAVESSADRIGAR